MPCRVLFICTANSARSQLAEALLRQQGGARFSAFSAGTRPGVVDPRALHALTGQGISTQGLYSKALNTFAGEDFDYVISLCDKALQDCVQPLRSSQQLDWNFPDPATSAESDAFLHTLQGIRERITMLVQIHSKPVATARQPVTPLSLFKALADQTRLNLLLLIAGKDELCVCELTSALDTEQPKISRHLALLRKAGLLQDQRRGQWVYYRLHPNLPDWARQIITATRQHLDNFSGTENT